MRDRIIGGTARRGQTRQWIDSVDAFPQELTDASLDSFPETLAFEDVIGDDPVDDYNELDKEPTLDG
jgi:hypothetical protein